MENKIEISYKTIIFAFLVFILIWLFIQIKDILLLLFISFVIMCALNPTVSRLQKWKIPRALSILIIYIIGLSLVGVIARVVIPPLINQSVHLVAGLPALISSILPNSQVDLDTIFQQIIPVSEGVVKFSVGIFSNILAIMSILVISFYFLLDRGKLRKYLVDFIGEKTGDNLFSLLAEIEHKLSDWIRGEMVLMTLIGLTTYAGLTLLRVEYSLPLAIFAGLLEIIPIIGPIISAIPAVVVALGISPGLALVVVALYTLIQQLENHLIVPTVMHHSVGLPPLVTIIALMIGARIAGIGGALLSVPLVVMLQVIVGTLLKSR